MKWLLVSNPASALQEYHLMENGERKVILKYNPLHHSARITCGKYHKLVYVETAGSLKPKTIFKNEYGSEIGSLVHDKWLNDQGNVIIEGKKYNYRLQKNPLSEMTIFNNDDSQTLVSCGLNTDDNVALFHNTNDIDNSFLLLGLCWYLFLPVVKETGLQVSFECGLQCRPWCHTSQI